MFYSKTSGSPKNCRIRNEKIEHTFLRTVKDNIKGFLRASLRQAIMVAGLLENKLITV
ncbi:hypothetical protein MUO98_01450 [Candidatus Bathyarchaeota archaeon]|nr:hypothetical protein [Candidatus Bathyarchaeota archaeon]